jgi:hypothetical protein
MSSVQEIKAAIRALKPDQRRELVRDLPTLLPELDGDVAWEKITRDSSPRSALTSMVNEVQAEYRRKPDEFPEIKDSDFESRA